MTMQQAETASAEAVPGHAGQLLESGRVFPLPPPPEIGALRSRHSNTIAGKINGKGWATACFSALTLGPFLVGFALAEVLGLPIAIMLPIGIVVAIAVFYVMIPRPTCTYVGENGLARIRVIHGKKVQETLPFSSNCSVGVQQTRMYTNGIYTGTQYCFTFYDSGDKRKFTILGSFREQKNQIPPDNDWHFGNQGESALVQFLLPRATHRLDQGEIESFSLSSGMKIDLGRDSIVFADANKRSEIHYSDLESVTVDKGTFYIREKGGKTGFLGIGQKGVFSFAYAAMPNARLFLLLLQRQVAQARRSEER